jgi:uncharacterized membrane protein YphA (DoxX/SURF4 family)
MTPGTKQWLKDGFGVAARLTLAVTFVWASWHKITDPYDFGLQVATYQILPLGLVNLQAIVLPWVEIATGLLLVAGLFTRPAALLTMAMNLMFITAIAIALSNDLHLQCGCFASSAAGEEMTVDLIYRDIGLLVLGAALVVLRPGRLTLDRLLERRRSHA